MIFNNIFFTINLPTWRASSCIHLQKLKVWYRYKQSQCLENCGPPAFMLPHFTIALKNAVPPSSSNDEGELNRTIDTFWCKVWIWQSTTNKLQLFSTTLAYHRWNSSSPSRAPSPEVKKKKKGCRAPSTTTRFIVPHVFPHRLITFSSLHVLPRGWNLVFPYDDLSMYYVPADICLSHWVMPGQMRAQKSPWVLDVIQQWCKLAHMVSQHWGHSSMLNN